MTRQGMRGQRGAGDGAPHGKALPRDQAGDGGQHRGFAAEQMRRAGDVQQQPVRRIQGHQGREAVAPVGDMFQQRGIGFFVRRHDGKRLHHGAGIGQRLAFIKPKLLRRAFQAIDIERVVGLVADDQRRLQTAIARVRMSRSVGRRGSHSARIRRVECGMFGIPGA